MEDSFTDTETEEQRRIRTGNGNLIPPVKGEVRNPNGRGKGVRNRSTVIREIIEAAAVEAFRSKSDLGQQLDQAVKPQTIFDQMVLAQVVKAVATSDTAAFKELADSAYGKLTDKVNTTHSFKKMGKVIVEQLPDPSAGLIAGAPQKVELSFDIGEEANEPENSIEDEGDDLHENYSS